MAHTATLLSKEGEGGVVFSGSVILLNFAQVGTVGTLLPGGSTPIIPGRGGGGGGGSFSRSSHTIDEKLVLSGYPVVARYILYYSVKEHCKTHTNQTQTIVLNFYKLESNHY